MFWISKCRKFSIVGKKNTIYITFSYLNSIRSGRYIQNTITNPVSHGVHEFFQMSIQAVLFNLLFNKSDKRNILMGILLGNIYFLKIVSSIAHIATNYQAIGTTHVPRFWYEVLFCLLEVE